MSIKLKGYVYLFLLFVFFTIWKLFAIEIDLGELKFLKTVLHLHNENLRFLYQLNQQQLILLQHLGSKESYNINHNLPTIYAITPTYSRYVQKAELTRISQTLMLVPNIHWIVVEDAEEKSELVTNFILECILITTHLNVKTPLKQLKNKDPWYHRGVEQRNMALKWLRDNRELNTEKGIVYFMDDDNTYNFRIFAEIAKVKKVGVWPVGLVGGSTVETPIVDLKTGGKVVGYRTGWEPNRSFAMDMAGFAINLDLILSKPQAQFSHLMRLGFQESEFLSLFVTKEELEPLADNCTKVYVWHTRTEIPVIKWIIPGLEV